MKAFGSKIGNVIGDVVGQLIRPSPPAGVPGNTSSGNNLYQFLEAFPGFPAASHKRISAALIHLKLAGKANVLCRSAKVLVISKRNRALQQS